MVQYSSRALRGRDVDDLISMYRYPQLSFLCRDENGENVTLKNYLYPVRCVARVSDGGL